MKNLRTAIVHIILTATLSIFTSCDFGGNKYDDGQADILFEKSVKLIRAYTDSMSKARDTISIQQLSEKFEHDLEKLNNSVPAETDMRMSEGQNDTLALLVERWITTRDTRLKKVIGQIPEDSIPVGNDTIPYKKD